MVFLAAACATNVSVKRDLSDMKANDVVMDDLCGMQEYFDALKDSSLAPPTEAFARDLGAEDSTRVLGGRKRFRFEGEFQLHYLRRLLENNWSSVPMEVARASRIELEVSWSDKAGVARVVTDEEALLSVGPKTWALPYHVCLSDFLFGETLYDTRRAMLNLPAPGPSPFSTARAAAPPPPPADRAPLGRPVFAAPAPAQPAPDPQPDQAAVPPADREPTPPERDERYSD